MIFSNSILALECALYLFIALFLLRILYRIAIRYFQSGLPINVWFRILGTSLFWPLSIVLGYGELMFKQGHKQIY